MAQNLKEIRIKVLKVDQPIGEFYIGAVDSKTLREVSFTDVREFLEDSASDLEGIQRRLSPSRVKQISQYVNFGFSTFPTSIILAIDERCAELIDDEHSFGFYELVIREYVDEDNPSNSIPLSETAFIIDGQHRLAGLENYKGDKPFELNVSIFVGIDNADKAEVFSTVNLAQTKVNRSLVLDLYDYQKNPSPYKTAHNVTVALDKNENGPFYEKIKRIGVSNPYRDSGSETLSQSTVVRGLLSHLPKNPELEKNKGFLGLAKSKEPKENWKSRIFCDFYRNEDIKSIYLIVDNYFSAVQERWPSAWEDSKQTFILNRTNGYNALIRFLRDSYLSILSNETESRVVSKEEFLKVMNSIDIPASKFISDNYKPGSSGASELYKELLFKADI